MKFYKAVLAVFLIVFSASVYAEGLAEVQAPSPASSQVGAEEAGGEAPVGLPHDLQYLFLSLGIGGVAGWAVGFTTKKIAKIAAVILGVVFIAVQYLSYKSYITVDWEKIKAAVPNEQLQCTAGSFFSVITYNLPFAGSFVLGFWMGFRKG